MNRLRVLITLSVLISAPASGAYVFTSLDYNSPTICSGTCGFGTTYGWAAVNDSNVVATSFSATAGYFGYTYSAGTYSSPIQNAGQQTSLAGIDDAGELSGFFLSAGVFKGLTDVSSTFSTVTMPSSTTFTDGTPNPFTTAVVAQTFTNGMEANGGTSSVAVGFFTISGQPGLTKGFVYNPANTTQPYSPVLCTATANTTNPYAINDSGVVVGYCKTSSGSFRQGFLYNYNTAPNTAPTILSSSSLAAALGDTVGNLSLTSIDDAGDLAGYYDGGANSQFNGFYCKGNYAFTNCSIVDFAQAAAFNQGATVNGTEIYGINNVGSLVGIYTETDGSTHAFLATSSAATPEPASFLLAAVPLMGLAALRHRRNVARRRT